jgi:hypothetical protein
LRGRSYRGGARALFVSLESPQSRECEYQSEQKIGPASRARCDLVVLCALAGAVVAIWTAENM